MKSLKIAKFYISNINGYKNLNVVKEENKIIEIFKIDVKNG